MKIHLNGKEINISIETTLLQLIADQGFAGKRLAAEVNHEIIPKAEHTHYKLKEQDRVEIVHAIGGG
ncbi:hypothetical protein MNBD_GAMMA09-1213 [hydrothermal vent metagenome]|uniref:Sulfur carrier protein ThiS n=1 Tax=hydrothermal vent metagenome TaxID=652676 RepID=A0A3B0XTM1_9ZZZZ